MGRATNAVCLTCVGLLLALAVGEIALSAVSAQTSNRAGLVVRFSDGSVVTRCIEFGEPELTGYGVLTRSSLRVVAAGGAICAIEDTGCPLESCLSCAYPNYWSYWHLIGGNWSYSAVGADAYRVHDGDVEGWSWGLGEPPPVVAFDQICPTLPTTAPSLYLPIVLSALWSPSNMEGSAAAPSNMEGSAAAPSVTLPFSVGQWLSQ